MIRSSARQTQGRTSGEDVLTSRLPIPRHDLAVICKAALVVPDLLREIRQQPWKSILQHVDGTELISKIFESALEPGEPASIAAFFASMPNSEASVLSLLLANKELNEQMGHLYLDAVGRRRASAQKAADCNCASACRGRSDRTATGNRGTQRSP